MAKLTFTAKGSAPSKKAQQGFSKKPAKAGGAGGTSGGSGGSGGGVGHSAAVGAGVEV